MAGQSTAREESQTEYREKEGGVGGAATGGVRCQSITSKPQGHGNTWVIII